ncbi:protein YgfX [Methylophaga sp. OBS3]|uniref:protein YgfX n=1 Tax=Methylophaga sp. OBS3 TaxID=2991934 RepID=UPI0022517D9E|nr:protein YgfX [Methylophaga sp. OBS3]MCX4190038.1 hypothetical protein [Methylophaga sp. OBS3]
MADNSLSLTVKSPKAVAWLSMLMHFLSVIAVVMTALLWWQKAIMFMLLIVSAIYYWRQLMSGGGVLLRYQQEKGWQIAFDKQTWHSIKIQQCFISMPLIIINYQKAKYRSRLLLVSGAIDSQAMRQLRLILQESH